MSDVSLVTCTYNSSSLSWGSPLQIICLHPTPLPNILLCCTNRLHVLFHYIKTTVSTVFLFFSFLAAPCSTSFVHYIHYVSPAHVQTISSPNENLNIFGSAIFGSCLFFFSASGLKKISKGNKHKKASCKEEASICLYKVLLSELDVVMYTTHYCTLQPFWAREKIQMIKTKNSTPVQFYEGEDYL